MNGYLIYFERLSASFLKGKNRGWYALVYASKYEIALHILKGSLKEKDDDPDDFIFTNVTLGLPL